MGLVAYSAPGNVFPMGSLHFGIRRHRGQHRAQWLSHTRTQVSGLKSNVQQYGEIPQRPPLAGDFSLMRPAAVPWAFGALGAAAQLPLIVDAVHVLGDELHLLHTADPAAVDESP